MRQQTLVLAQEILESLSRGQTERLTLAPVLATMTPMPIQLACDASPYGIGAVISHIMPDGLEHPVAYASHTLTASKCNYA